MIECEEIRLPANYGVLQFTLPAELFKSIKNKCSELEKNLDKKELQYQSLLAGHIEREMKFPLDMRFRCFLDDLAKTFCQYFNLDVQNFPQLETCWINFQKKHEFNPLHTHSGVLSFVLWIQIPYLLEDEDSAAHAKNANTKESGRFHMLYNSTFDGKISKLKIDLDKSYEGKGIIFPASANHLVYPFFTSDEFRISISGNFVLKPT